MKKIEDYLHLYLGCGIVVEKAKENFNWVSENPTILTPHILNLQKEGGFSFKPTLRPLSDMTEEEILYCVGIAYKCVYGNDPEFIRTEMVDSNHEEAGIVCEEPGWRYGFTVNQYEIEFSANGSRLNIYTYEIIRYILSCGFDIFGLIESGLATSKTSTNAK